MQYVNYEESILRGKRIVMSGWPVNIPIRCPSGLIREDVRTLINLITAKPPELKFRKLTPVQLSQYLKNEGDAGHALGRDGQEKVQSGRKRGSGVGGFEGAKNGKRSRKDNRLFTSSS